MSTATNDVHDPGPVPERDIAPVPVSYDPDWLLADIRTQQLEHSRALRNARAAHNDAGRLAWYQHARIVALMLADNIARLDDHLATGGPLPRAWAAPRPPAALTPLERAERNHRKDPNR